MPCGSGCRVAATALVACANREVQVALDPTRMLALGVTAARLSRQFKNVQQEAAGGRAQRRPGGDVWGRGVALRF